MVRFHLPVGPRMLHLGQPVLDVVLVTDAIENVVEGIFVMSVVGELNAVVGQNDVDAVGHGRDQIAQELRRDHLATFLMQLDKRELARSIDRHKQA